MKVNNGHIEWEGGNNHKAQASHLPCYVFSERVKHCYCNWQQLDTCLYTRTAVCRTVYFKFFVGPALICNEHTKTAATTEGEKSSITPPSASERAVNFANIGLCSLYSSCSKSYLHTISRFRDSLHTGKILESGDWNKLTEVVSW